MDHIQQVALMIASGTLVLALAMWLRPDRGPAYSPQKAARLLRESGLAILSGGFVALTSLALIPLVRDPRFYELRDALPTGPPDPLTTACVVLVLLLLCVERGRWAGHAPATVLAVLVPWLLIPEWDFEEDFRLPAEVLGLFSAALYRVTLSSARSAQLANTARATAIDATGDGVLLVDVEGRLVDANSSGRHAFAALAARDRDETSGRSVGPARLPKRVRDLLQSPDPRHFTLRNASNDAYQVWLGASDPGRNTRSVRALIVRDVSEKLRDENRLIKMAHYDSLTGLANRRLFIEQLEHALDDARNRTTAVALLYIDLDRFKEINDTLGHGAGDEMLRVVAGRFQERIAAAYPAGLRRRAASVARLGGDEFAIVVPEPENTGAIEALAGQLLASLAMPIPLPDREIAGSASIGIALHPQDGRDVETLVKHADSALYGAKRLGRNRFERYKPEFSREADRKRRIEEQLRGAIDRNELELHYQPKVDVASARVGGFEALLRWNSRELGRVGPDEFIPIAEERGLIAEIGNWCLDEACRQQRGWTDAGLETVPVAVNVSSAQFIGSDLQDHVRQAIERHEIEPHTLEIELTERLLLEDSDQTSTCLRELQALGVSIALDDFGTGYSALTYLNRFPLNVVKMDRGLLENVETSESAAGIAAAVIAMCHSIGLKVVAEGVDSEGQHEILQEMSCDQIQGYLFAPALKAEDARRFLAAPGVDRPRVAPKPPIAPITPQRSVRPRASEHAGDETWQTTSVDGQSGLGKLPHVLLVDDTGSLQQTLAPRLERLGVPVHDMTAAALTGRHALPGDGDFHLIVTSPSSNIALATQIVEVASNDDTGHQPALVFVGDEPNEMRRETIRAAGARMVLWSPFDDNEIRFLVRAGVPLADAEANRDDVRVPLDSMAWIRFRSRREVGVLSSLSRRGAFIELANPLENGVSCKIEVDLPSGRISTFAKVIYSHVGGPDTGDGLASGIGVEFYGMNPACEFAIAEVVDASAARYRP